MFGFGEKRLVDYSTLTPEEKAKKKKELLALKAKYLKEKAKADKQRREKLALIRNYEEQNKILYFGHPGKGYLGKYGKWEPNAPQKDLFSGFSNPQYSVFTYTGGNRGGKTFSLVSLAFTCLKGRFPWEDEGKGTWLWNMLGWKPPIKIRLIGQDWEKHIKAVLIPRIKELVPASWKVEVRKNNVGVEAYWTFDTGSIEIMSNKSESDLHEGWEGHLIGYDEPPKRAVRIANARGLVDYNGREIFSMTLLKEAWVDREVINALDDNGEPALDVYNVHAKIYDNIGFGINEEGVKKFASKLNDDEKSSRLDGVPSYKAGVILNINKKLHILDKTPQHIHPDWVFDVLIDYHPAKHQYVMFLATDQQGFKYVPLSLRFYGNGETIAHEIIKAKDRYHLRINRIMADPLSKTGEKNKAATGAKTIYSEIEDELEKFNLALESAGELKQLKGDGISKINSLLMTNNGFPALFFFKRQNEDYPINTIQQLMDWMYDENGEPSKVDDDSPENLYRGVLLDTEWYPPYQEQYEEYAMPRDALGANSVTGY